jgi:hypothetical protein
LDKEVEEVCIKQDSIGMDPNVKPDAAGSSLALEDVEHISGAPYAQQ